MTLTEVLQNLKVDGKYCINGEPAVYKYTGVVHPDSETIEFINPEGVIVTFNCNQILHIEETNNPRYGMKFDAVGKLRWDLLPIEFEEVIKVLTKGAKKYADNNWMYVDQAYDRYYAAARRHMEEFRKAIKKGLPRVDKEMGTHLLANAICDLIFLMYMDMNDWPNQKIKPTERRWTDDGES